MLAGCLDVAAQVQVSEQDRITGTMLVTISRDVAAQAGINSVADLAEQVAGSELPDGVVVQTTADEDKFTVTLTGDLSANDGLMTATHSGQEQTFTVANEADPGQDEPGEPADTYQIEVTADFAGTVTAVSGEAAQELDANTVRFAGPLLGQWRASAKIDLARPVPAARDTVSATPVAPATSRAAGPAVAGLLGIGVLLVAALGAAAFLVRRQSRGRA